jgi:hypothetical protein
LGRSCVVSRESEHMADETNLGRLLQQITEGAGWNGLRKRSCCGRRSYQAPELLWQPPPVAAPRRTWPTEPCHDMEPWNCIAQLKIPGRFSGVHSPRDVRLPGVQVYHMLLPASGRQVQAQSFFPEETMHPNSFRKDTCWPQCFKDTSRVDLGCAVQPAHRS